MTVWLNCYQTQRFSTNGLEKVQIYKQNARNILNQRKQIHKFVHIIPNKYVHGRPPPPHTHYVTSAAAESILSRKACFGFENK